uniref:Uncharacterized protein n=1 Tax=Chromera velia CCMP2878 TaxID=1169474 RepID=A0A0G4FYV3_9ALVE|eukprot:Cvel_3940.t1-p1 / transcript=Cvel_3940.t1 / gene=Cvel_3940 / organism=Chromera_velia_CCMP2878 / gene_product=hypothetical protein / transcript_product=hypothetical protein / location=Cvel_scaffold167:66855-71522(-) / protein_length=983 / sequence_SO=supercontig / SO=protein_coding / is_pseudo=false
MSQIIDSSQNSPPAADNLQMTGTTSLHMTDNVLCSLIEHARPTAEEISELASGRKGFGLALILLGFIRTGRSLLPLATLDLSGFALSARKLKLLLSSLPSGPGVVETLRCGPHVCKDACLPVLLDFLHRLKAGGARGAPFISLKTLNLAKCDLGATINPIFPLLPPSLEHLDLSGGRLRRVSVEGLASVFSFGWLPNLLSLDLSDNPLGPSGLRALVKALSSCPQSLSLQSLKLARTKAKAEGVEALAEALKAKKTTSLQTLDLAENEMRPAGLKHLASAVNAEAVPHLKVLVLKKNELADLPHHEIDYAPISELLTTNALKELEEFDLSNNALFDEGVDEIGGEDADEDTDADENGDEDGGGSEGQAEGGSIVPSAATLAVPGRFPKVRRLDLGGRYPAVVSSEQLAAFATSLGVGGLPSLQELVLPGGGSYGSPNPQGGVAFANALTSGHLSQLRCLKLQSRSDMTGEAFAGLCRSLARGKVSLLQSLDLDMYDDDAEEGVVALAEGIQGQRLSSLESFRLSLPNVKGFAVSGLGLAFGCGGCPGLQKLDLKWSEEGDEGVRGLAEGLVGGRLSCLRDLSLTLDCGVEGEGETEWAGEGCIALGEVLSTGKLPSLRTVRMDWLCSQSFPSLCEGLSRGRVDPPLLLDINLEGENFHSADAPVTRFAEVIRAGKLSGLRSFKYQWYPPMLSREGWRMFGEALSHADALLNSLEEVHILSQTQEANAAFFEGLSRGTGRLLALHTLHCVYGSTIGTEGAQSLSALVTGGRVPSLKDLKVKLGGIGQEGMQAFAAALGSPHVSALRRLDVFIWREVGMFSVALSSGHLRRLEELQVRGLRLIEEIHALCVGLGSGKLSSLRTLHFCDCSFGGEGGRALSELLVAEKLPSLRILEVGFTGLGDEGVRALVEVWMTRDPPPLQHLNFQQNQLTGAIVNPVLRLLGSQQLPALETLSLFGNGRIDERSRQSLFGTFPEVVKFDYSVL